MEKNKNETGFYDFISFYSFFKRKINDFIPWPKDWLLSCFTLFYFLFHLLFFLPFRFYYNTRKPAWKHHASWVIGSVMLNLWVPAHVKLVARFCSLGKKNHQYIFFLSLIVIARIAERISWPLNLESFSLIKGVNSLSLLYPRQGHLSQLLDVWLFSETFSLEEF